MKLEQQVSSLELAQKLKELGVKQESLFYWRNIGTEKDSWHFGMFKSIDDWDESDDKVFSGVGVSSHGDIDIEEAKEVVSAFTVAELGEMLPFGRIVTVTVDYRSEYKVGFRVEYYKDGDVVVAFADRNEADARAKCLIYLLENGIIKSNDL